MSQMNSFIEIVSKEVETKTNVKIENMSLSCQVILNDSYGTLSIQWHFYSNSPQSK